MRIYAEGWKDYELIDAGNNKKLERWGEVVTIRPERNAYFQAVLPKKAWYERAHFEFDEEAKSWKNLKGNDHEWPIEFKGISLNLKLTKWKHLGIFPEQRLNWDYIAEHIKEGDRFLNLFGYTGGASLIARSKGADVFHCDSVKQIISWGKENMESSSLTDIHWVLEDAMKFAMRETKRGNKYKGIIMDPPAFGLGKKGERWKIENKIEELLGCAKQLLDENGFLILNTYSPRLTEEKIAKLCKDHFRDKKVSVDLLCIKSKSGKVIEYGQRTLIS